MTGGAILKELLKVVPYLDPEDVSAAVVYVLGTPPHVEVRFYYFVRSYIYIDIYWTYFF